MKLIIAKQTLITPNFYRYLLAVLFLSAFQIMAQVKVYPSFVDYATQQPESYKSLKTIQNDSCVKLITTSNKKIVIRKDSIWGFENKHNEVKRYYHDTGYDLKASHDSIYIYTVKKERTPLIVGDMIVHSKQEYYYFFSKTLNSPIIELKLENLLKAFQFNSLQSEQLEELNAKKELTKTNVETGSFYLLKVFE